MAHDWISICPSCILFVSPHPDDICIGMGALAFNLSQRTTDTSMVLITDGSEGRMADVTLLRHGWQNSFDRASSTRIRGSIRIAEARNEAALLNIAQVVKLPSQDWHQNPHTDASAMDAYGGLLDIEGFKPGPIDDNARRAVISMIRALNTQALIFLPHPHDRQHIHRITTRLFLDAILAAPDIPRIAFYEALSCHKKAIVPDGFLDAPFCYGEDESRIKTKAIKAHISQHERRAAIGSYTSADSRDYATIANERSADLARIMRSQLPFAERYVLSHPDLDKETLITALWDFQKC